MKPDRLLKSKTFWTGVAAMVGAGSMYATGESTAPEAVRLGVEGALAVFLRMAIGKGINAGVKF